MNRHQWRFTKEKIATRIALIEPAVFRRRIPIEPFRFLRLNGARIDAPICADPSTWEEVPSESYWGEADLNFVMKSGFTVPDGWSAERLALHLPLGVLGDIFNHPESLAYVDATPIGSADRYHHVLPLAPALADGKRHMISLHGWTGHAGWPPDPNSRAKLFMGRPELVERDPATFDFVILAKSALDAVRVLHHEAPEAHGLLDALDSAFRALDTRDPIGERFYATVLSALNTLKDGIANAGAPRDESLHAIGHAHMDIAYLWTVGQMRLKNARTYTNVLRLMDAHPVFRFSHSQPALYAMVAEDYPDIFERIKARVAEGRWEPIGGMWVEPDLNIPGPEALVRQLTLGRGYYKQAFGEVDTPVLWVPDTFGFPGQIPQLMARAGLRWFVTNKLNWNQVNRVPWSTHVWRGIDGTEVLAHILTTPRDVQYLPFPTNYKSDLSAPEVLGTVTHAIGDQRTDLPICFGYGDGGGGPTEGLLARVHVMGRMPGMPRVRFSTVRAALEALETRRDSLPVWSGEHYLEGHRGVFTSQGWIKRANRLAERALHEAEALAAMAGKLTDLSEAWKLLCLNQFHDIVTGTSIGEVYDDARKDFDHIEKLTEGAAREASDLLAGSEPVVLNTAPTDGPRLLVSDLGPDLPGQPVEGGRLHLLTLPAYSVTPLSAARYPGTPVTLTETEHGILLDNGILRATVASNGQITALYDYEAAREVIAPRAVGNQLQAFEDRPICWDAWDIDPFIEDRREIISAPAAVDIVETGPIRVALRITHRWRRSTIVQTISLCAENRRLDTRAEVDWHETHMLLKVAFPVTISAPRARFDIQWGDIDRSTTRDTQFDAARFEVPAQKWAELSDGDYAVALLNDCKYGYDVRDHVLRLTLIKSATAPDPNADQGRHTFTYALLANPGADRALLDHAAYDLNTPIRVLPGRKDASNGSTSFVSINTPDVVMETLKPAESGEGVVVRVFESRGTQRTATLSFDHRIATASLVDFHEEVISSLSPGARSVTLNLGPYEIASLHITFARPD